MFRDDGQTQDNTPRLVMPQDLNAERWKPMVYAVTIDVPVTANGIGRGNIQMNDQAIILTRASVMILGNTEDPETSGLYQDGQYLLTMQDEERVYSNVPVQADLLWGPKRVGPWRSFEYPIYYTRSHAVRFEVINIYTRVLTPQASNFQVQIALSGLADFGRRG